MGGCVSIDNIEVPQNDEPPIQLIEQRRSLIEFVRALSEPTLKTKRLSVDTISSVNELTAAQEAFLSRHKMRVYGISDPISRLSTFEYIEEDFYNTYHKHLLRKVLHELFKLE